MLLEEDVAQESWGLHHRRYLRHWASPLLPSLLQKRALLPSREASPAVVAQPSTGAATPAVAGRRRQWGRWRGRFLLLFRASELRAAARTDARAPEVPIRFELKG